MSKNEIAPRANERVRLSAYLFDKNVTFKQKVSYFWHYYKWYVIATVALLLLCGSFIHTMTSSVSPDAVVMYAGPVQLDQYQVNEMNRAFESVMSTGFRYPESRVVQMSRFLLLSEAQMNEMRAQAQADNVPPPSFWGMSDIFHVFNQEMMSGDTIILLLDPHLFETQRNMHRLASLEFIFGEGNVPEIAQCNYGIRLRDTEFAQYFPAFDVLPDDTILAMKAPVLFRNRRFYEHSRLFFQDIVNFKPVD